MAALITRQTSGLGATVKGSPLTNTEVDTNFINLNTAIEAIDFDPLISETPPIAPGVGKLWCRPSDATLFIAYDDGVDLVWVQLGGGVRGYDGLSVPAGGTLNQVLAKASSADYDYTWKTPVEDPRVYIKLDSTFTTSSSTAVNVTGLSFAPAANKTYEIYGQFLFRTNTATVGPRPGVAWPTGMVDGAARMATPSSATAILTANGNVSGAILTAVGGLPTTTGSWVGTIEGLLIAGASPAGNFQITLASETNGTNVHIRAGSYICYREI